MHTRPARHCGVMRNVGPIARESDRNHRRPRRLNDRFVAPGLARVEPQVHYTSSSRTPKWLFLHIPGSHERVLVPSALTRKSHRCGLERRRISSKRAGWVARAWRRRGWSGHVGDVRRRSIVKLAWANAVGAFATKFKVLPVSALAGRRVVKGRHEDKPPPSSPCRLLPSQLRDGVLRSPANCHRGPSVQLSASRIGKSFAISLATRRMDFRWIHKGITRERQTNIPNYTRFNYAVDEGNYVRDYMPGNEFRYLPAQWNSFERPSMSDYCVDSYHYCLINEYRSLPVEYIKSERDIKTAKRDTSITWVAVIRCNQIIGGRIRCTASPGCYSPMSIPTTARSAPSARLTTDQPCTDY
ncbi:hypothetical protein ALC53_01241 [Atta colombica]|uniref:Uncharacterized protein n=1 Tax=Atta colombica TaxID=520822 RepID=A0A195BW34_9HYME|nr:hypothetical protein ALC53_01241 [Atta colombica]